MKRIYFTLGALAVGGVETSLAQVDLFDGKTLSGWEQHSGKAEYRVENGEIVGRTVPNTGNSFLCTTKNYADFVLELEFKVDPAINSGIQFRSEFHKKPTEARIQGKTFSFPADRVHGYQFEIDPSERAWSAGIYDEGRRGWLFDLKNNEAARKAFKQGEWNAAKIECQGERIKTWLNGVLAADFSDNVTRSGLIALQVHGVGNKAEAVGKEIRWRKIRLRELAASHTLRSFQKKQLTDVYYCEGAGAGDFNRDGTPDVVAGPYWYAGPSYTEKREIYPPKPQNLKGYADNFFSFAQDFDRDGWEDVLVVGFPGTPAAWYRNPGNEAKHWARNEVFDWVSNESPRFVQLVGDERPELVCTRMGRYGYVTVNWDQPTQPWAFKRISDPMIGADERFGHGLGVGDVNADGRPDVLCKDGWFEQPNDYANASQWSFHPVEFSGPGGAQMYAYDVDGDGDQDVISSLQAHSHGLAWFANDGKGGFEKRLIMGQTPRDNRYGVVFSELHAVDLADMNGDGLMDIVTGKTYWSHHMREISWNDGAVVCWFELRRDKGQAEFIPRMADDDSGIGRQVLAVDMNKDGMKDIVTANMKGTFVLLQESKAVGEEEWKAAQPKAWPSASGPPTGELPRDESGRPLNFDFEEGTLKDWSASGEAWQGQPVRGEIDPARKWGEGKQARPDGHHWIGGFEVHQDDKPQGTLSSAPFVVSQRYASYRIGGGSTWATRLELVLADSGELIYASHGRNNETMFPEVVDLSAYQGRKLRLRLVDESSEAFGHLNFDNFRLHEKLPVFPDAVNMVKRPGRLPTIPQ